MARGGNYRDRAVFLRETPGVVDKYGNEGVAPAEFLRLWADLRETPGREKLIAGRLEDKVTGTLRVRAGAKARSILASDTVSVRGATWSITAGPAQVSRKGEVLEFLIERGGAL